LIEAIADGLGDRGTAGNLHQRFLDPGPQRRDERLGFLLPHSPALIGTLAADLGFDPVEFGDPLQGLGSDRRGRRSGDIEPLPPPMCPTERQRHRAAGALGIGEAAVGGIPVGLQDAGIALEQRRRVLAAAPRCVAVDHRRRRPTLPRPVVAREHPEVALLGTAAAGIEHRRRRLVDEKLGRAQQFGAHQPPERHQLGGGVANPESQHGALDLDPLRQQDLGLSV
jgi:hypothetical protein